MKEQLENFMQQNKEAFDMHEPNPEVWKAIHKNTAKNKVRSLQWLKYAAALVIFIAGFSIGTNYTKWSRSEKLAKINHEKFEEQSQLIESEYYYVTKINVKMGELAPFFASDPQLKQDIDFDFEELDTFYKKLKTDLDDDINNEHVIEAMIQSYEMKLQILETLLEQLKPDDNEKTEIDI